MNGKMQGRSVSGPDTVWQLVSVSLLSLNSPASGLKYVLALVEVAGVDNVADVVEVAEISSLTTNTLKSCSETVISWSSLVIRQADMLGLVHPMKLR